MVLWTSQAESKGVTLEGGKMSGSDLIAAGFCLACITIMLVILNGISENK